MEIIKKAMFVACILIRVEHTDEYDSIKYRLIEYHTHCEINPRFKLADLIPLEAQNL
jgi:hypothetical protein